MGNAAEIVRSGAGSSVHGCWRAIAGLIADMTFVRPLANAKRRLCRRIRL
jgi:hypothetical protein